MFKRLIYIAFFIALHSFSQEKEVQLISYNFNEIAALQLQEKRPVVVFLHTNWCKYCFAMKKNTFTNKNVKTLLNTKFYFISFNAEFKEPIHFNNHTFNYKPTGRKTGVHELAIALTENKLSYPSTIVLSLKNEILLQATTFLNHKDLIEALKEIKNK